MLSKPKRLQIGESLIFVCYAVPEADVDKILVQYQEHACEMVGQQSSTFTDFDFDPVECWLESLMFATMAGKKPYCKLWNVAQMLTCHVSWPGNC